MIENHTPSLWFKKSIQKPGNSQAVYRIRWIQWIRIRMRNRDPGGAKMTHKSRKKLRPYFEVLAVVFDPPPKKFQL